MDQYYNRYQEFLINGQQTVVPYVSLPSKGTDQRFIYKASVSRLDKVSQQYYDSPFFGASKELQGGATSGTRIGYRDWETDRKSVV